MSGRRCFTWLMWWAGLFIVGTEYGAMPMVLFLFGSAITAYLASQEQ